MKTIFQKILTITCVLLAVSILYIPFRMFAQKFNIVFPGYLDPDMNELYNSDNFYHWFSILVWPTYATMVGFLPFCCARLLRFRWYLYVALCIVLLLLWDYITVLDTWFGIPGGGLSGFNNYPANHPGINTPQISVMICPFAMIAGAILGFIFAKIRTKKSVKSENNS